MSFRPTRLPQQFVKIVLISGEYPQLAQSLKKLEIGVITTAEDLRLPYAVRWHPDMQVCLLRDELFTLRGGSLTNTLREHGLYVKETLQTPQNYFPQDALCNVLVWEKWGVGCSRSTDALIRQRVATLGLTWIEVKQGYTACSVAMVNANSAITSDSSIADKLRKHGLQVLLIEPGYIMLPGYPYGFIGGCCGKLAPHLMAFTGQLDRHPDGSAIRCFLKNRGVEPLEFMDGALLDIGGILTLK